jgi:hypothetical protein
MANPRASKAQLVDPSNNPMITDQQTNIPSYDITWTANEPTAGDTHTIADGDVPTVAELGQAVADLTAKVNALITLVETHGFAADA